MDVLDIHDAAAGPWLNRRLPKLHLLMGDSVARNSGMHSRVLADAFLDRTWGGATWKSLADHLPGLLQDWTREATRRGRRLGAAVVWLSGNDVYSRASGLPSYSEGSLLDISVVAGDITDALLRMAEQVTVLGPLPRLACETPGVPWERTAAFHLERRLVHQLPSEVYKVCWGRQLTRKFGGRSSCFEGCSRWYAEDRIHLSPLGYSKLADSSEFPIWLRMSAAADL